MTNRQNLEQIILTDLPRVAISELSKFRTSPLTFDQSPLYTCKNFIIMEKFRVAFNISFFKVMVIYWILHHSCNFFYKLLEVTNFNESTSHPQVLLLCPSYKAPHQSSFVFHSRLSTWNSSNSIIHLPKYSKYLLYRLIISAQNLLYSSFTFVHFWTTFKDIKFWFFLSRVTFLFSCLNVCVKYSHSQRIF